MLCQDTADDIDATEGVPSSSAASASSGPEPAARGVFLRKIARGAIAVEIPILPDTKINRGDIPRIFERLKTAGCEMVIGSRFVAAGQMHSDPIRVEV